MRLFLTPVFCALVKFAIAPKLSLWVRTVPPAVLPLLAMMAAIPLVCGLTLSGFGPIWHAATMLAALLLVCGLALVGLGPIWFAATLVTLMGSMALLIGLTLAREDVDVPGAVSMVDAARFVRCCCSCCTGWRESGCGRCAFCRCSRA